MRSSSDSSCRPAAAWLPPATAAATATDIPRPTNTLTTIAPPPGAESRDCRTGATELGRRRSRRLARGPCGDCEVVAFEFPQLGQEGVELLLHGVTP
jgi:hypothetical protein